MAAVTEAELLTALQAALAGGAIDESGAMTVAELTAALGPGWYEQKVRKQLMRLKDEGRLEVLTVKREALDGKMRSRPAYRLRDIE